MVNHIPSFSTSLTIFSLRGPFCHRELDLQCSSLRFHLRWGKLQMVGEKAESGGVIGVISPERALKSISICKILINFGLEWPVHSKQLPLTNLERKMKGKTPKGQPSPDSSFSTPYQLGTFGAVLEYLSQINNIHILVRQVSYNFSFLSPVFSSGAKKVYE